MENDDVLNQVGDMEMQEPVDAVEESMHSEGYIESKPADLSSDDFEEDEIPEMGLEAPGSKTKRLLDALSDPEKTGVIEKREERTRPLVDRTPEQEEAELLEGVKSERGRERIKNIINARKEAEARLSEKELHVESLKEMVSGTGMKVDELVQTMEFGRLVNAGDENSLLIALNMVEEQRENICKRLGIAAPGVNLLSDFPELQEAVRKREITPEHAAKLAKYQRSEREQRQSMQIRQNQEQEVKQHNDLVMQASQSAMSYLMTRKGEADFHAKLEHIQKYFQDPGKLQAFVNTYDPKLWFAQIKFMYDNIVVPPARSPAFSQPIRSRPVMSGSAASNPNASNAERLLGHLDKLGI